MTVIAYRAGVLASESRVWVHSEDAGARYFDTSPKLFRKFAGTDKEAILATAGESDPANKFVEWYGTRRKAPSFKGATVLVLTASGMLEYDESSTGEAVYGDYYAIGTGCKIALGALFMGATAEEAVRAACAHDPYCGGPVHAWKIGDGKVLSWLTSPVR